MGFGGIGASSSSEINCPENHGCTINIPEFSLEVSPLSWREN